MSYNKFNYREPPYETESWDQFVVRKAIMELLNLPTTDVMSEEREYDESKKREGL
tara:strand:+ start:132 stop:296 length:165 start_codon:yes stop_codon:yes gene_type:complete